MKAVISSVVVAVAGLAGLTASAWIDDGEKIVVGTHETMTVEVPSDAAWDKPVVVAGVLRKVGAGTLTITGEKLYGPGRIEVSEGGLSLTATGAGSAVLPEPTAIMNGAAMWLDASMHVAGPDGAAATGDAAFWYDVRETGWATPGFTTNYLYAQASTDLSTDSLWPTLGADESSRSYIDFGGFGSGQYMVWRTPAGAKAWIPVVHSFFAYNPNNTNGHFLGTATYDANKLMCFAASDTGDTVFNPYVNSPLQHLRLGRVFRDGTQIDLSTAFDKTVVQLLETETYRPDGYAEAFFNFRNYQQSAGSGSAGNRVGGGRLHEVLVFTNAISEIDRVLVEQHLMRKWIKTSGYAIPPSIRVDAGATLTIADALVSATTITSDGIVSRPGSVVSLHEGADQFGWFRGTVTLDAGAVASNRACAAVAPVAGKTYDVDANNTLTVSGGESGVVAKTGVGSLAFEGLGAAERATVSNGRVSLRAAVPVNEDPIAANCIADGGFEGLWSGTGWNAYGNNVALGSSKAWTVTNFNSSGSTRIAYTTGWSTMWKSGLVLGAPEGDYYLVLKQGGGVKQTVSLSRSGRYVITLRAYPRSDGETSMGFFRVFVDGYAVGTVQVRRGEKEWDCIRLVTPFVEAGSHVVSMISETTYDLAIGIDDVKMVWLDDVRDIAVANGNFENIDWSLMPSQNATAYAINTNKVFGLSTGWFPGWTVGGTGKAWGLRRLPYLRSASGFVGLENDNGSMSVLLSNGGTVGQNVTIPETGIYRLSVKAARYQNNAVVGGGVNLAADTSGGTGEIAISIGGTSESFSFMDWAMAERRLSTPVLLEKDATVEISVTATDISEKVNNVVIDDVRVVMETGNVVNNPGFEGSVSDIVPEKWTVLSNPNNVAGATGSVSDYLGAAPIEGAKRGQLGGGTHIAQDVPLSAGYWRLSFWDVSRSNFGRVRPEDGPLPICVTLARGAETNFCETVTPSTSCPDFIRREYLLKIDTAGTYTLGFEAGPAESADPRSYIDAVCLAPVLNMSDTAVPVVSADAEIGVAAGASLGLDWTGILSCGRLRCAGRSYSGEISSATAPESLFGIGQFSIISKGMLFIIY